MTCRTSSPRSHGEDLGRARWAIISRPAESPARPAVSQNHASTPTATTSAAHRPSVWRRRTLPARQGLLNAPKMLKVTKADSAARVRTPSSIGAAGSNIVCHSRPICPGVIPNRRENVSYGCQASTAAAAVPSGNRSPSLPIAPRPGRRPSHTRRPSARPIATQTPTMIGTKIRGDPAVTARGTTNRVATTTTSTKSRHSVKLRYRSRPSVALRPHAFSASLSSYPRLWPGEGARPRAITCCSSLVTSADGITPRPRRSSASAPNARTMASEHSRLTTLKIRRLSDDT